ncbi:hypothetical protein [Lysinibacillus sp. NPDC056232]|uniref:hypothetical protein n=1 Tax=Lysinibacillus sp. NPDC056232 TaxID=3345756 RepID=UPI0035DE8433
MAFARKRSANAAAARCFVCAKAKRQQQHDVGPQAFSQGCEVLSLNSSISADVWTPAEK